MDRTFRDQINRVSPLDVPGLTRVWHVDLATPGDGPDDQRAARARVEALKAALPDILRQFEHAGLTKRRVRRSPTRDDSAAQDSLRGLGVQLCSSFDPHPDQSPQVFFRDAPLGGATGPSMIVDAVNENLPNKVRKLVNAKTARAAEAHLFLWLNSAQEHKRARAEAMSFLSRTGPDGLSRSTCKASTRSGSLLTLVRAMPPTVGTTGPSCASTQTDGTTGSSGEATDVDPIHKWRPSPQCGREQKSPHSLAAGTHHPDSQPGPPHTNFDNYRIRA